MFQSNYSQDIWSPLGNSDAFGVEPKPHVRQLVNAYNSTVYGLVKLIASKIGEISEEHLRLAVAGPTTKPTRQLSAKTKIPAKFRLKHTQHSEITDHPLLTLIENPNDHMTKPELIAGTVTYLDCSGNAYWYLQPSEYSGLNPTKPPIPQAIFLLPSQTVKTIKDANGYPVRYETGTGQAKEEYDAKDVIHFKEWSLLDPYANTENKCPVQAIWLELQTQLKEMSSWDARITNEAEPRVSISPSDDKSLMGPAEAERLGKKYTEQFGRGGKGGPLVSPSPVKVQPLSWPPKDMSSLELYNLIYKIACRVFGVPTNYQDMLESSLASSDAAERSLQKNCLRPRINTIIATLNKYLTSRYDKRLFFVVDEFEVEDKQFELAETQAYLQSGVLVPNEQRAKLGLAPRQGGDAPINQPAQIPLTLSMPQAKSKRKRKTKATKTTLETLIDALQEIFRGQAEQVLAGLSKRVKKVPKGLWFDLDTDTMVEKLQPILEVFYRESSDQLVQRLGFNSAVPKVVNQGIPAAVKAALLAFCDETNATTSKKIEDALADLRTQLQEGLEKGEAANKLTARVKEIFDEAETDRAYRIAVTEASRAQHAGEILTIKAAGVDDAKKVWIATSNSCDECKKLNGKTVGLDEPFYVDPKGGPYAKVMHGPKHPGCRCSLDYDIGE